MAKVIFQEKQKFRSIWLWILLGGLDLLFAWAVFQQLVLGKAFGENPAPDWALLLFGLIPFGLTFFFLKMSLCTEITREYIKVELFPLSEEQIEWTEVAQAYVRTYRPLGEFGGWGLRFGFKGSKAYNVSGNKGLQLELKNGKKILIGTQKAEELTSALSELGFHHPPPE